jgi:hypothetical protein
MAEEKEARLRLEAEAKAALEAERDRQNEERRKREQLEQQACFACWIARKLVLMRFVFSVGRGQGEKQTAATRVRAETDPAAS